MINPLKASELGARIGAEMASGEDRVVNEVKQLSEKAEEHSLTWCNDKFKDKLINIQSGIVLVSNSTFEYHKNNHPHFNSLTWLVAEQPRIAFVKSLSVLFDNSPKFGQISESARIHPEAVVSDTCFIGENVVIEKGVEIGSHVSVLHNTSILENTVIQDRVSIGCNCTIGGVGFGYEQDENDQYILMPHVGGVLLSEGVEIGNNVCIDRAVMGQTTLGPNVKVDNLVHIAHGVKIDSNSLIIANAMVAGSVEIGKNVWVAPSSSIIQKAKVGDDALIGMGAVVIRDVEEKSTVVGNPGKKLGPK